jgi:hypothetical protein
MGGDRLLDIVRPRTRCERDEAVYLDYGSKNGALTAIATIAGDTPADHTYVCCIMHYSMRNAT